MSIPNDIKLAKFGECLIYTDKAYKEFSKKIKEAIKVNSFTYKTRICKLEAIQILLLVKEYIA